MIETIYLVLSLAAIGLILFGALKQNAVPVLIGGMVLFVCGVMLFTQGIDRYVGETRTVSSLDENVTVIDYNIQTVRAVTSSGAISDAGVWTMAMLMGVGGIVFMLLPFGLVFLSGKD